MTYEFKWADSLDEDIIWGQLADGTYFMGIDEYDHAVWFFDMDPYENFLSADDNDGVDDFVECYSTGELDIADQRQFWEECLNFIAENPNSNPSIAFDWVEVIDPQYAIYGQLADGTYFMAGGYRNVNKEEPMVAFTDANPEEFYNWDSDDDGDDQWVAAHVIQELKHPENLDFWDALIEYCEDNGLWV